MPQGMSVLCSGSIRATTVGPGHLDWLAVPPGTPQLVSATSQKWLSALHPEESTASGFLTEVERSRIKLNRADPSQAGSQTQDWQEELVTFSNEAPCWDLQHATV